MKKYSEMTEAQLTAEHAAVKAKYEQLCAKGLKLDMSRGKPGPDQLSISNNILDLVPSNSDIHSRDGIDCRNYGGLDGLVELKELFADILEVPASNVIVGGNASLNLMFDTISQCMTHGMGGEPWMKQGTVKFLCPVPGYDRHFGICEYFGIEMINVPLTENGPDMDAVEELIKDEKVKGMWCVPKYSNPDGIVYSDEVIKRLAAMQPAAPDFRIFWDNAYVIHPIFGECDKMLSLYDECVKEGNPNRAIMFTSTSKITFPGAGVSAMAAGDDDIVRIKRRMNYQTIGPDKINHLRHARLLPDIEAVREHMKLHAAKMRPKFEAVLNVLDRELSATGIARWTKPRGGYFISMFTEHGCAKKIVALCKDAGLILTPAGATYPYGMDPDDSNIRIAPSFPSPEELTEATELLCTVTKLVTLEKLLNL